jgi:hypothetical protein
MKAPPQLNEFGEGACIRRFTQPLFIMLGGEHPPFELLSLRLGLEALTDPLAIPPLGAKVDKVTISGGFYAHRRSAML